METPLQGEILNSILPIFSGQWRKRKFEVAECHGTAFPIGGHLFLTANHVMEKAQSTKRIVAIGHHHTQKPGWGSSTIKLKASWPGIDICVIRTRDKLNLRPPVWVMNPLSTFSSVQALGYPFALRESFDPPTLTPRGFRGHVVAIRPDFEYSDHAEVLELSFGAPSGLSGAPLFSGDMRGVSGVVIGNHTTKIESVQQESEETHEGARKTIIYRTSDFLHLGVAVTGAAIMNQRINRRTVAEHIKRSGGTVLEFDLMHAMAEAGWGPGAGRF